MKAFSFLLTFIASVLLFASSVAAQHKDLVGWVEKVRLHPGSLLVHAKLDTGAKTSSLNAQQVTEFTQGGERWVRFDLINRDGDRVKFERKVERTAKIKRPPEESEGRLVIRMGICLGNIYKEAEVNLVDRTGFNYPMLLGRSFMEGSFIIDPSATYTSEPHCEGVPRP